MPQKSIKIKICGLTRKEDIEYVNELQPDYIGFVFAPESRRYVTPEQAARLRSLLSRDITPVGVFVNETPEQVADLLNQGIIGIAQLHGREEETYISRLRQLTDKPLIQAFRIVSREDIEKAKHSTADFILLDSGAGGTGEVFDWSLLKQITRFKGENSLQPEKRNASGHPWFLAGGLTPENVGQALELQRPMAGVENEGQNETLEFLGFYGVDVSSGVETDGRKDYYKIKKFVSEVRKYDQKRVKIEKTNGDRRGTKRISP